MTPAPSASTPLPPPVLVEDQASWEELFRKLEAAEEIAIDTEADSFYRYQERVCLIQITVADEDYLVDPLCSFDLVGLGEVLADPAKTKVFHDGEYDVLILKRDYGFTFSGLFDTRVAAAALGLARAGPKKLPPAALSTAVKPASRSRAPPTMARPSAK